jgi:hypothetical protein
MVYEVEGDVTAGWEWQKPGVDRACSAPDFGITEVAFASRKLKSAVVEFDDDAAGAPSWPEVVEFVGEPLSGSQRAATWKVFVSVEFKELIGGRQLFGWDDEVDVECRAKTRLRVVVAEHEGGPLERECLDSVGLKQADQPARLADHSKLTRRPDLCRFPEACAKMVGNQLQCIDLRQIITEQWEDHEVLAAFA